MFQETLSHKGKIFKTLEDLQTTCEGIFQPELAESPPPLDPPGASWWAGSRGGPAGGPASTRSNRAPQEAGRNTLTTKGPDSKRSLAEVKPFFLALSYT